MDIKGISKVAEGLKQSQQVEPTAEQIKAADTRADNFKAHFHRVFKEKKGYEFTIDAENTKQFDLLVWYFVKHPYFLKVENKTSTVVNDYSFSKGVMLLGNVGCGKTTMFNTVLDVLRGFQMGFLIHSCLDVEEGFAKSGYESLENYGKPYTKAFDDLGFDDVVKFYGNEERIMIRVIEKRHRLFIDSNVITHFTTNLGGEEIKARYGDRIHSRLKEMCNIITFGKNAKDRRK